MSSTHEPRTERTETRNAAPRQLRYGGVLLAAGESRRMGGPNKLEIKLDGVPLVRRTAQTLLAAGIAPLIVVLGHAAERIAPLLDGLPVRWRRQCRLPRWPAEFRVERIMGAPVDPVDAYVVRLSDLPLMSAAQLRELFDAFERHPDIMILVPMHEASAKQPGRLRCRAARRAAGQWGQGAREPGSTRTPARCAGTPWGTWASPPIWTRSMTWPRWADCRTRRGSSCRERVRCRGARCRRRGSVLRGCGRAARPEGAADRP